MLTASGAIEVQFSGVGAGASGGVGGDGGIATSADQLDETVGGMGGNGGSGGTVSVDWTTGTITTSQFGIVTRCHRRFEQRQPDDRPSSP